ncbi:MAG: glycosyltransferase [Bryobacterales bacterium]|nr:glycosyltransferase [Bryobacterales bacterium]
MIHRDLSVPPRAGAHLHTTKLAAELQRRGHHVEYFCFVLDQNEELPFPVHQVAPAPESEGEAWIEDSKLMRNLQRYWATSAGDLLGMHRAIERARCDLVIGSGIHGLLYLRLAKRELRIWYPADDLFSTAMTLLSFSNTLRRNWAIFGEGARSLLIQRWCRDVPDETWMVAQRDMRSMRRLLGRPVVWLPNGVDLEFFRPLETPLTPHSAVFWGRLDFDPNEQALEFFLGKVWPLVRARQPEARLVVMGFAPSEKVVRLTENAPGVELRSNVPDIRPVVCSAPVAIFPFVSGTGVKNKLLEGAAMGRALLVSPMATDGLRGADPAPWRLCKKPEQWRDALLELWRDPRAAAELGARARRWVENNHSWEATGALAEESFERARARREERP